MKKVHILWTDDEIDLLKPHLLFLEEKGYEITTATNGNDAIDLVQKISFDLVFLDENMPGLSGLETLPRIKSVKPSLPVVMITKSEEENIMDAAIGSQIADYLIKPVNPNQILLSIKKNIDTKSLITRETTSAYQSEFTQISMLINNALSFNDWVNVYSKLVFWELELEKSEDNSMNDVLRMQKADANQGFGKYIKKHYFNWFDPEDTSKPLLSPNLIKEKVIPAINKNKKTVFIVIDNLRYDQWKSIQPTVLENYNIVEEVAVCSILPTATQYARNSIFAGLMPKEIAQYFPDKWISEEEEGSKNKYEKELLLSQLQRLGIKKKVYFEKINTNKAGVKVIDNLANILQNDIIVLVYNFIDMLSHANTEMEMIRELASSDSAFRSLTLSWFQHSHLNELLKAVAIKNIEVLLTTDHGTIRVVKPVKVIGDKATSKNLRYKLGKNLSYNPREVFEIKDPGKIHLPKSNVSSKYIFALGQDYFVYPNNYNYYVNFYSNTYQHGGISLEEMVIPFLHLQSKL